MPVIGGGRYELLRRIGKGGMSEIWLAADRRLETTWAVKITPKDAAVNPATELAMLRTLNHPALPRIVDIFESEDRCYLVMDYVEGCSLDRLLKKHGPFGEKQVLTWAAELAGALRYLHTRTPPVIYRDLKPSNLMLQPDGHLKLIDFGISRLYRQGQKADTEPLGTNGYAAPEQYGGRQSDARADIYSLGMTCAELLTGISPAKDLYLGSYHPFRKIRPGISEETEVILNRCLAFDPAKRYQSAAALLADLACPSRVTVGYRKKKQRRRLARSVCLAAAALAVFLAAGSGVVREQKYRELMRVPASASCEEKEQRYLAAAELSAGSLAPVQALEEVYREDFFGEEEERQLAKLLQTKAETLKKRADREAYRQLLFEAGKLCFYHYQTDTAGTDRAEAGMDSSFRERVLKAEPYFREAADGKVAAGGTEYETGADAYLTFCVFCRKYLFRADGVAEPSKEEYEEILTSFEELLADFRSRAAEGGEDAAYMQLLTQKEMADMLLVHRRGLADKEISKARVLGILDGIGEISASAAVTQERSVTLQKQLQELVQECIARVGQTYENAAKFRRAGKQILRTERRVE